MVEAHHNSPLTDTPSSHHRASSAMMVERAVSRTNPTLFRAIYEDSIEFFQKCHWRRAANYRDLYIKDGLSAAQIGEKLGIPKQTVLNQLRRDGIRLGSNKGRMTNPENYRLASAPYGFSKKEGRLVPHKAELKVCRTIVQLRNNSNLSFHEIARG
jgi:hypothetical protein